MCPRIPFQIYLIAVVAAFAAHAQPAFVEPPDRDIAPDTRAQVIEATLAAIDKSYVFPEVGERMAKAVKERERMGAYDGIASAREFARALTADLQQVSRDKHLRVAYRPGAEGAPPPRPLLKNHGFEKAEMLPGNIGYLEVSSFQGTGEEAARAAAEAMAIVADADALIVDLRRNGGGSPHTVAMLSSYLFDEPTHLNSLYWRERDRTDDFWTTREVQGRRFGQKKPVYVLTSKRTFSGAEEFSYNLKALKRATLIGETTGGGAHPGGVRRVHELFTVFVPTGRAINPITKTNWEGTGVAPDVEVPAEQALDRARELALKSRAS
ncbi:MAG TPA: S41 family peptidase [Usitatibacter sp.]|nr:S41 family peptidase [Usitatibacter sp.]